MNSLINPAVYSDTFALPSGAVDSHIKIATAAQLKVLLFIFRNANIDLDADAIAKTLGLNTEEVKDAIGYWTGAGYLKGETLAAKVETQTVKKARMQSELPSREEIARLSHDDEDLRVLYREAQNTFCRPLKQSEASLLAWLYNDEGMPVSVILMLLRLATQQGSVTKTFIESTAIKWLNDGVSTIEDAEEKTREALLYDQSFKLVCSAFGISKRKPGKKENEYAFKWVNEYKISKELLTAAYEICVDTTGKYSIDYINTILEKWHKNGVKTLKDIENLPSKESPKKKNDFDAYDKDIINRIINSED
jgi:DnaD/phage-associated family protein